MCKTGFALIINELIKLNKFCAFNCDLFVEGRPVRFNTPQRRRKFNDHIVEISNLEKASYSN